MSLLAGLGVDLLAQMLEFVDPANQLNFALSGLLQGLENINQVFPDSNMRNLHQFLLVKLKFVNSHQEFKIWSLECKIEDVASRNILKKVLDAEYFNCTRKLELNLSSVNQTLFMLEDLGYVFKHCPRLTNLDIILSNRSLGMELEKSTNFDWELRQGFQKLKSVQFVNCLGRLFHNSWPIYQLVLTWCGNCQDLAVEEYHVRSVSEPVDFSLIPMDPRFGHKLKNLIFRIDSVHRLLDWLKAYIPTVESLDIGSLNQTNQIRAAELLQFRNLNALSIYIQLEDNHLHILKEILRSCTQLKRLEVDFHIMPIGHVWATVFEQPAANILELDLTWSTSPFIEDALLVFKRWTDLRRLKLRITSRDDEDVAAPPFELVCDVIRNMRSLTCLSIADDGFDHDEIAILQSKVDDKVKVPRPNFVFKVKVE